MVASTTFRAMLTVATAVAIATPTQAGPVVPDARGPLARSVSREAYRLANTDDALSMQAAALTTPGKNQSDWQRVTRITPDTRLLVATRSGPSLDQHMLCSDETSISFLRADTPGLSKAVLTALAAEAARRPQRCISPEPGQDLELAEGDLHMRLSADGVFLRDQEGTFRKVASLADAVLRVPREDVVQVSTPASGHKGAAFLVGGGLGALAGAVIGASGCSGKVPCLGPGAGAIAPVLGLGIGLTAFGVEAVVEAGRKRAPHVVYRAP